MSPRKVKHPTESISAAPSARFISWRGVDSEQAVIRLTFDWLYCQSECLVEKDGGAFVQCHEAIGDLAAKGGHTGQPGLRQRPLLAVFARPLCCTALHLR